MCITALATGSASNRIEVTPLNTKGVTERG
jgi:hypothetical protein